MKEQEEDKLYVKFKNYFREPKNVMSVFSTASAFLTALILYTIVSGVSEGFSWGSLWNWKSLAVMFLGGLGIMFVQEDGMIKGWFAFNRKEHVEEYRKENKEIQDTIVEFDFRSSFVRELNVNNVKLLKENYQIKREHELGVQIENNKFNNKPYKQLEEELERIKSGDIRNNEIDYTPYEISDIFSLVSSEKKIGKEEFEDDSGKLQRRSNLYARIYSPIIMLLITTVLSSVVKNLWTLLWSAMSFLFLLLFQWYLAYQKKLDLSDSITLTIIQNKNNILKQAQKKYVEYEKKKVVKESIILNDLKGSDSVSVSGNVVVDN